MITVQKAVSSRAVPSPARLRRYVRAALNGKEAEITLRVVGAAESKRLNRLYRGKDKPTNVLSFDYAPSPPTPLPRAGEGRRAQRAGRGSIQGDIIICAPVVRREAREQGKAAAAHWAHMIVHGVLHLRGFDHIAPRDARRMEARERAILARLRYPDPYTLFPSKSH